LTAISFVFPFTASAKMPAQKAAMRVAQQIKNNKEPPIVTSNNDNLFRSSIYCVHLLEGILNCFIKKLFL
jgi:uncharacterized protein YeaO (DUF488 family)